MDIVEGQEKMNNQIDPSLNDELYMFLSGAHFEKASDGIKAAQFAARLMEQIDASKEPEQPQCDIKDLIGEPVKSICVMVSDVGSTHMTPAEDYYTLRNQSHEQR